MKISVVPTSNFVAYRIELDKTQQPVEKVPEPVNHIWIFDRSGSMYGLLNGLVEDLIKHVETLRDGDTLSLGWFSTEGTEFGFIFTGMTVTPASRTSISSTLRKYNSTVGLTCFSDILLEADKTVETLSAFPGAWNMMFMTDGYPVVRDRQREIHHVMNALGKLSRRLSSVLLVGYGDYYNKEFMAQMTEKVGGALVHSSHLEEFSNNMNAFVSGGAVATKRIEVPVPVAEPKMAIGLSNGQITVFPLDHKNTATTVALVPESTQFVYVLSDNNVIPDLTWYNTNVVSDLETYEMFSAFAYTALASGQADLALELMAETGDVALMERVINSWTNEEFAEAQRMVNKAIAQDTARYVKGVNKNYIPRVDAFCLIDALNMLMADENAYFYPKHPEFAYKRTGVPTKTRDGYPRFYADRDAACKFNTLTWNSSRLNLSVLAKITGTVDLPENCIHHGFGGATGVDRTFFCHQWRNYTLVKDGILNLNDIPASMSADSFAMLQMNGMINPEEHYNAGDIYIVKLNAVPIVNKMMAVAPKSTLYCDWLNEELTLEYAQKYLKHWLEELDPTGIMTKDVSEFSPQQEAYLATIGMKPDRTYSPPVDKEPAVDHYMARSFEVKIAKFSSAPKIDDVLKAISFQKQLTPSQDLMAQVIKAYEMRKLDTGGDPVVLANRVKTELETVKSQLKAVRHRIQTTRFAVLLCKQWFPDLTTRDGAEIDYLNKHFTFTIKEVEVDY